tara:strand:- start:5695 stop:6291 length:597 start_codon:yes stop_codon:yes gene_type:complete
MHTTYTRQTLRQHFRQKRNSLSDEQQIRASHELLSQCLVTEQYQQANNIACYLAQDGEISMQPVIEDAWMQRKIVCLPVLHPFAKGQLLFLRYHKDSQMKANRFGIPEPAMRVTDIVPLPLIDVIFAPLVAFDSQAHRLGMGGGFYDRTLAPVARNTFTTEVYGVAHDCQNVLNGIKNDKWDIPMQKIITPSKIYIAP